jgi:hypothetical protein
VRHATAFLIASLLPALSALAADYERVLLPIVSNGQAAFGSNWQTDLWVRNDGATPINIYPFAMPCQTVSTRCPDFVPVGQVAPHTTLAYYTLNTPYSIFPAFIPISDAHAGVIAYVSPSSDSVRFGIHVRDISRTNQNIGTDIPVVRERELRSDAISLLNVPVVSNYRYGLRIYALDGPGPATFAVRVFEPDLFSNERLLVEQQVQLSVPDVTITCGTHPGPCPYPDVPFAPAYVFIPLDLASFSPKYPVRIEVSPESQLKFWCLLSATNNDTQLVTIYSPR